MSHEHHRECRIHITRERLTEIVNQVLDAWDVCNFDLATELVERVTNASTTICSIPMNPEPKPPKDGPYR